MTYRTPAMLVCVYYRIDAGDSQQVISTVREFQRTLRQGSGVMEAEVLIRCDLPSAASLDSLPDAPPVSVLSLDPPTDRDAPVAAGAEATVMETYHLNLTAAATGDAEAAVRAFLATLAAVAEPLGGSLRGTRHVELFAPCVS